MVTQAQVEAVYTHIWNHLCEHEALPTRLDTAAALKLSRAKVTAAVKLLIRDGRLDADKLPTAYPAWWRANIAAGQRWELPKLISIYPKPPKQLPLWL